MNIEIKNYSKRKVTPTSIRLEQELYNKIKEDAKREKRSISGQIEYMLEKYYQIKEQI